MWGSQPAERPGMLLFIEKNLQIPIAMKTYIYLIILLFPAVVGE
jgi:hypothetical protein